MVEPMSWDDEPWLLKRQEAYDKLMAEMELPQDRASDAMFDLDKAVMVELDKLPYESGGRSR